MTPTSGDTTSLLDTSAAVAFLTGDHDHHDARQDEGEGIGARIHQRPLQDSPKASANGRAEMR